MSIARTNPVSGFCSNVNLINYLFGTEYVRLQSQLCLTDLMPSWLEKTTDSSDTVNALRELLIARHYEEVDSGLDEEDVNNLIYMLAAG